MKLRQHDIVKLKEQYTDGYDYAMITFPTRPGDDFYIIDAVPCTINGDVAKGFECGIPMEIGNFEKVIGNYYE